MNYKKLLLYALIFLLVSTNIVLGISLYNVEKNNSKNTNDSKENNTNTETTSIPTPIATIS